MFIPGKIPNKFKNFLFKQIKCKNVITPINIYSKYYYIFYSNRMDFKIQMYKKLLLILQSFCKTQITI